MRIRKPILFGILALASVVGYGVWAANGRLEASITRQQIQHRIDQRIGQEVEIKGQAALIARTVVLRSATVAIADGKIGVAIQVDGVLKGDKAFSLAATTHGAPEYRDGAFYFHADTVEVAKATVEGVSASDSATRIIGKLVTNDTLKAILHDKATAAADWATAENKVALARLASDVPIYRLKDDVKGTLLRASLESVRIDGDRVVAAFSIWSLTMSLAIFLFCGVAAAGLYIAFQTWIFGGVVETSIDAVKLYDQH